MLSKVAASMRAILTEESLHLITYLRGNYQQYINAYNLMCLLQEITQANLTRTVSPPLEISSRKHKHTLGCTFYGRPHKSNSFSVGLENVIRQVFLKRIKTVGRYPNPSVCAIIKISFLIF